MAFSENFKVWLVLIFLTIMAVVSSDSTNNSSLYLLIGIALVKFLAVCFFFMEIKKAHSLYKLLLIGFSLVFAIVLFFI